MSATPKFDLSTPAGRKAAEKDYMWWGDHAFLRKLVKNRHWVDPGRLMRGNQPSPQQLAGLKEAGFKTIINLRGGDGSFALLEREACETLDDLRSSFPNLRGPLAERSAESRRRAGCR